MFIRRWDEISQTGCCKFDAEQFYGTSCRANVALVQLPFEHRETETRAVTAIR
jgi:hypothetical protein